MPCRILTNNEINDKYLFHSELPLVQEIHNHFEVGESDAAECDNQMACDVIKGDRTEQVIEVSKGEMVYLNL